MSSDKIINLDLAHLKSITITDAEENVNPYGYEQLDYITSSDMDKILDNVKSYDDACATPGALIKHMHFNLDHPENRNVVMNDEGDTCIFDGEDWRVIDKETFHSLVVDRAFNIVTNYYIRRRELYKLKNGLLRSQYELLDKFKEYKEDIMEKYKTIGNTNITVKPLFCPNHPRKRNTQNIKCDSLNDNKYDESILDLYGNDNLDRYYSYKNRQIEIENELSDDNLNTDDKDILRNELIILMDKLVEFDEKEKELLAADI
jgi:hypothetical protein